MKIEINWKLLVLALLAMVILTYARSVSNVMAQDNDKKAPPTAAPNVAPKAADVSSMDATIAALYDSISGPAGNRDWDRVRSLFFPGARLIITSATANGTISTRVLTVEEFISGAGKYIESNGFFEKEIARSTESYGNIAHVFSTYESRNKADDPKPFVRGINSIQLMNDGKRWWVITIFWQPEGKENPIPEKYLK